ncbi:MAG: tetratricopeptide repeat protein [Desulfobulbus sp.]|jgi:tetratricopeptide (TPR) repeat protein
MGNWLMMVGLAAVVVLVVGLLVVRKRKAVQDAVQQAASSVSETAASEPSLADPSSSPQPDFTEQERKAPADVSDATVPAPAAVSREVATPPQDTDYAGADMAAPVEPVAKEPVKQDRVAGGEEIDFPLAAFADRLRSQEEQVRTLLDRAVSSGDVPQQEQLRKKLVRVNRALTLLTDSHARELTCYRQVLALLPDFAATVDAAERRQVAAGLRVGDAAAAESLLVRLGQGTHPAAARAAWLSGRLAECRFDLEQAMQQYRAAVQQESDNPLYLQEAGRAARELYNYQEALPLLDRLVRIVSKQNADDPVAVAKAQRELAYTYVLSGRYREAGTLYKASMTVLARELGQEDREMAISWHQIGEYQETLGEYDKAVGLYQRSLAIQEKQLGADHPALAAVLEKLAGLCMELEREPEAVSLYERLVRIREKTLPPTHPQLLISLNDLAEAYRLQGHYAQAEACYRKALAITEQVHGGHHPRVAAVLQELAKLCAAQQRPEEARVLKERAAVIFQRSVEEAERDSGPQSLTLEL